MWFFSKLSTISQISILDCESWCGLRFGRFFIYPMHNCNFLVEFYLCSFIHSGDLYNASSRDYYSEVLATQLRLCILPYIPQSLMKCSTVVGTRSWITQLFIKGIYSVDQSGWVLLIDGTNYINCNIVLSEFCACSFNWFTFWCWYCFLQNHYIVQLSLLSFNNYCLNEIWL